ncbi:hypothetical protein RQP46_000744 [Phenoliferia psychrophenolica]
MKTSGALEVRRCSTPAHLTVAHAIRVKVFVDEQHFTNEFDEQDDASDHFVLFSPEKEPIGTIRYFPPTGNLGRIAVLKEGRGMGAGRALVRALEDHVAHGRGKAGKFHGETNEVKITANSHCHTQNFYEKLGYKAEGEPFLEDNKPHIRVTKTIKIITLREISNLDTVTESALSATSTEQFVTLDGSVASDQRMELVDEFNNKPDVFCFLISTRAGGVGLNLTAANRAMDRAYRFGQTRDVNVYRLVGGGTLEELIYNRQQYKRSQMNMGYDGTAEKRIYTGVEGEKDRSLPDAGIRKEL